MAGRQSTPGLERRAALPVDGRPPIEGRPLNEGRPLKDGRPLNPLPRDLRVDLLLASSLLTRDAPSDWREFITLSARWTTHLA
eukprot:7150085-Pyramimonas_sp.AAC.1